MSRGLSNDVVGDSNPEVNALRQAMANINPADLTPEESQLLLEKLQNLQERIDQRLRVLGEEA